MSNRVSYALTSVGLGRRPASDSTTGSSGRLDSASVNSSVICTSSSCMMETLQMGVPFRWDHGDEAFETEHCMCRPSAVPIRSAQRRRTSATDRAISVARRSGGPRGMRSARRRRGRRRVDRSTECRRCSRRNVDAALALAHAVRVSGTPWPVSRVTPPVNPTRALDRLDHRRAALP